MPALGLDDQPAGTDVVEGGRTGGWLPRGLVLLGVTAFVGALLLGSDPAGPAPSPPPSVPSTVVTTLEPVALAGSCVGQVTMLSSAGAQVRLSIHSPPALAVSVGDEVSLMATGPCGWALWMSPQRDGVFTTSGLLSSRSLRALTPGIVRVGVTHWACAERPTYDPDCRGLIALDGYVDVIVRATST